MSVMPAAAGHSTQSRRWEGPWAVGGASARAGARYAATLRIRFAGARRGCAAPSVVVIESVVCLVYAYTSRPFGSGISRPNSFA
jgi:hypothetical protein